MFEQGELRSRREEWNLNGVKNLLGARPFPNTLKKITDFGMEAYPNPLTSFKFGMYFAII
jgi:hypothetical protein